MEKLTSDIQRRPWGAIAFRIVTDIVVIQVATLVGLLVDYGIRQSLSEMGNVSVTEWYLGFWPSSWILTALGVSCFGVFGFYSRNRNYRARHKAWAIVKGVSFAYLAYGAVAYALRSTNDQIPVYALVVSGAVTLVTVLVLRLQSTSLAMVSVRVIDPSPQTKSASTGQADTVLVIGGAGYIGSALVNRLLASGKRVTVLDRLDFGLDALKGDLADPNLELVEGDFRRVDQLILAMRRASSVVHLGGLVGDPACARDEDLTIEMNLTSTRMVAEVAKAHGVKRFIFASSCSVYGASDEILDERSKLNPVSLYAQTKIASEQVLHGLTDRCFRPTILRFGTVFGLSGRSRFDLVVNLLSAKAVRDGIITVYGPSQWRPFVHVDDVARSIVLCLEGPESVVLGSTYNVGGNGLNTTLGELGTLIRSRVPGARVVVEDTVEDRRNYRVSFNHIEQELGFRPNWRLVDGIDQVIGHLRANPKFDYRSPVCSNVARIEQQLLQGTLSEIRKQDVSLLDKENHVAVS